MGFFNKIISTIFGHASAPATPTGATSAPVVSANPAEATPAAPGAPVIPAASTPAPAAPVDVDAVLGGLAAKNSEKLDWKKSIVDLLKLLDIDSSLSARKELAAELHYPGDTSDSAAMNIWLHKAVLKKLSENGGKVPADLLD